MDISIRQSKSSFNDSNEDVKVFIKLSSKEENMMQRRVFFFEENREILFLQRGLESILRYKYDYIFSDYENTLLISSSIRSTITQLLRNEKNIILLTFGEEKLGATKFMFGNSNGSRIHKDSLFKFTYDHILGIMSKEFYFDNILIDVFRISNEKYQLDYRNIAHDLRYDIIGVINQIIKDGSSNSVSSTNVNDCQDTAGHLIISLKFFKFITDADISKEQREVEIIRTVSFVDIEGFNQTFTQVLLNNNSNQPVSARKDPKNYSLINLKNLIESIAAHDLEKYAEVNSNLTSLLSEILRTQSSSLLVFGFIDQYDSSILESTVSLEILNKFKILNPDLFFSRVQEMNIDISQLDNKCLKEEFHIVELIFSEILYYIEKTFLKKITSDNCENCPTTFNEEFFTEIKDMEQQEKYAFLKSWLEKKNYNFENNIVLNNVIENVFNFFQSRAKWKSLYKARDEIIKLSSSFKEAEPLNTEMYCLTRRSEVMRTISVNETDELKSVLRNISKIVKNVEENDQNNSIFDKISENNVNLPTSAVLVENGEHKEKAQADNNKNNTPSKSKIQLKTTVDTTTRHSIETSFAQLIFKDFLKNMKYSCENIYSRLNQEDGCFGCQSSQESFPAIDFRISSNNFKLLKAAAVHNNKEISFEFKKESTLENNLKSTNNFTKMEEIYKNQETHFKGFGNNIEAIGQTQSNNIFNNKSKAQLSDILSTNQMHMGDKVSKYSQSIQLFKCNTKKSQNTNSNANASFDQNRILESPISVNMNGPFQTKNGEKASSQQMTLKMSINKEFLNTFPKNTSLNKSSLSIVKPNEIDVSLSQRIAKIDEKLKEININHKNTSQLHTYMQHQKCEKNLDSQIKTVNDMSDYEDSRIIKNKSFLSLNY